MCVLRCGVCGYQWPHKGEAGEKIDGLALNVLLLAHSSGFQCRQAGHPLPHLPMSIRAKMLHRSALSSNATSCAYHRWELPY